MDNNKLHTITMEIRNKEEIIETCSKDSNVMHYLKKIMGKLWVFIYLDMFIYS